MKFEKDTPYPTVRVEKQNIEYANILRQDYAGEVSEDTAVHQYLYQSILKKGTYPEFSDMMEKIAIQEMIHLKLLGETITLLGSEPTFEVKDANLLECVPWSASYVNFTNDLKKMLKDNIIAEKDAIRNYKLHRLIINDTYIRELLNRIIEDEEEHIRIFESFYEKIKKENI